MGFNCSNWTLFSHKYSHFELVNKRFSFLLCLINLSIQDLDLGVIGYHASQHVLMLCSLPSSSSDRLRLNLCL